MKYYGYKKNSKNISHIALCTVRKLVLIKHYILLFINYMYYTVCVIASSTIFLNFSVNLNTKQKRMDNFPEVVNTAFLSTFIFCDSLDSQILIFLHWPSNPLTFKFNRFRIFISIPFHVTLYLFLICVITFIFDSIPSWIIVKSSANQTTTRIVFIQIPSNYGITLATNFRLANLQTPLKNIFLHL